MIRPAEKDYELYLGSTFMDRMIWWNKSMNEAYDLTDAKIRMQVRPKVDSDEIIMDLSTDNGKIVIDDHLNGKFHFHVPFSETELIDSSKYRSAVYDLEVELEGYVYTILKGKIKFSRQVTR